MEAYQIVGIVLVITGFVLFILRGIFRIGEGRGRQKWMYYKFGSGVTRAMNIITSVLLIISGIVLISLNFN